MLSKLHSIHSMLASTSMTLGTDLSSYLFSNCLFVNSAGDKVSVITNKTTDTSKDGVLKSSHLSKKNETMWTFEYVNDKGETKELVRSEFQHCSCTLLRLSVFESDLSFCHSLTLLRSASLSLSLFFLNLNFHRRSK